MTTIIVYVGSSERRSYQNTGTSIYTVFQKKFTLFVFTITKSDVDQFLQRVSIACYAERCISHSKSVRLSVRLSVCHTLALSQNDTSYDHGVLLEDSPMTLVSSTLDFTAKFQREHGERGRQMREG